MFDSSENVPLVPNNEPLHVIVLAGGKGTRLQSVVADAPKILAPLGERTFLDVLLTWLEQQKITSVTFSLGVMAEQVISYLAHVTKQYPFEINYVVEKEPLGTLGGVAQGLAAIAERSQSASSGDEVINDVVVINGDTWLDVDLSHFLSEQRVHQNTLALVCYEVEDVSRFGALMLGEKGKLAAFHEKPSVLENSVLANNKDMGQSKGWINAGIYYLHRCYWSEIIAHERGSIERDFLMPNTVKTAYFKANCDVFIDIGTPESYAQAPTVLREFLV